MAEYVTYVCDNIHVSILLLLLDYVYILLL